MGLSDLVKKATGAPTPEKTRSSSISYGRPSLEQDSVDKGAEGDDVSVLDEKEGNVILAMISQLRPGMDLSKIAFPTFVLEPRSMLERITDFFSHPDLIFGADKNEDPTERFLAVLRYYLSGWHIKPKGVKKPYNAVLGEIFRCSYRYPDGSEGFYVAEQVSHHPPVSAYFYISPANGVLIYGELRPKSKFLGNSAATIMDGENRVILMNKRQDGEYSIGMPNMYARGILFGKLILELGDTSAVRNPTTGLACDVEFKTKGFFSGTYNAVVGKVKKDGHTIGDLDGFWSDSVVYKDVKTGKKQTLFDAHSASVTPKIVAPESEQEPNESRRLWSGLTAAIRNQDMEGATEAKNAVEERQRERARERGDENIPLRYFRQAGDKYVPLCGVIDLPKDPKECVEKIRSWIWPQGAGAPSASNGPTSPSAARAVPVPTAAASQRGGTVAGSSMSSSSSGGSFQSAASSHPIGYSPVSPQRQAPASTASTEPIIPAGSGAPPEMTTSLAGSASRSTASSTTLPEGPTPEQVAASLAEAHITAPGPPKGAVSPQPPLRSAAD